MRYKTATVEQICVRLSKVTRQARMQLMERYKNQGDDETLMKLLKAYHMLKWQKTLEKFGLTET